ncbi:DUF1414 domain-containing protein [Motilimonas pumila]|uniref:UPF0352 protein D1Z90_15180 n=1 Tax=Motilimonas pumila TaxID=2303987 RepID=A0A418YBS9_9GAMM|nr:DUF1414 domain-containing protein [Motilimonas pumila]RJG41976.1 DUF1414 domain-containing protein [Motilimonas pumila]
MPIVSKYKNEQVEAIINDVVAVLQQHNAPMDLALMVLGNTTSDLINSNIQPAQRAAIAEKFAAALTAAIDQE